MGIQDDEVFFATSIFHLPGSAIFEAHIFHSQIPLMRLSYLGALKTWIYFPILLRIRPSYLTIRLPMLLVGAVTIWLFMWFLEKAHGRRVAWVGGVLLATDTMYLLTTCFDWGPVALQHLLALAGMAMVLKFTSTGQRSTLFWAFFWFGLTLWDKALFLWFFSGLVVATIAIFPRELWARSNRKNLGLAVAGLLLGALPLVAYNLVSNFNTFRSNSRFLLSQFPSRLQALRITLDGQILFDYMVHAPWVSGTPLQPRTALERVSTGVHELSGGRDHYHNELVPALWVALALLPLLFLNRERTRARRTMLFCLVVFVVAWLQMALTENAGSSAHHVVLLWPLPQWFLAIAMVEAAAWRPLQWKHAGTVLLAAAVVFLAGANLLLTNEYLYQLAVYGPIGSWNDAIFRLSDEARNIQAEHLVVDDWGILNPLVALNRNRLPMYYAGTSFLSPGYPKSDYGWFIDRLSEDVWIGHTPQFQQLAGEYERIVQVARTAGYEKQLIRTVPDRHGKPAFEIFRFVQIKPQAPENGR